MARNSADPKAKIVAIRKSIRPLMAANDKETWREALRRFHQFVSGDIDAWIDEDSGEVTVINLAQETGTPGYACESAESAERMKYYAAEYGGFPLPAELIELMCGHGCFKMPVGNSREYASLFTTAKNSGDGNLRLGWSLKTVDDTLKWNFGEFPDGLFTADQLQYFSQNLLFWGYFSSENDGNYTYMFVDRAGRYGLFQYNQEDWPSTCQRFIEPITRGMDERYSLDQLISKLVDSVIVRLSQRHELPMLRRHERAMDTLGRIRKSAPQCFTTDVSISIRKRHGLPTVCLVGSGGFAFRLPVSNGTVTRQRVDSARALINACP